MAAGVAWWEMDCRSGAVRFHPRKVEMLGFGPTAFTHYTHFTALLHPEDLEPAMAAMRGHLEGTLAEYRIDYRIRHEDGTYRWFQDIGCITQRDEDGRPAIVTGVVLDVSSHKQLEDVVRLERTRLRALFEGHSAVMLVIDPSTGGIVEANPAAERFYGWSLAALTRMHIQQINVLPYADVAKAMVTAGSTQNARFEFQHRTADGAIRDVEVFSNRIEVDGHVLLYSIIHDIGQRKQAEAALRQHEQSLVHAERFAQFGHWEFCLHDRVMHASHGAARIYGFTDLQLPLADVQQCVVAEDRPRLDVALRDLIEREVPYDIEFWIHRVSDGAAVAVHSRAEFDRITQRVFGVVQDITTRKRVEGERETLILQLQSAIEHIKTLKGIVPICASCKKIRDDKGYWQQVEAYLARHTDVRFSHGICPECMQKHYPQS